MALGKIFEAFPCSLHIQSRHEAHIGKAKKKNVKMSKLFFHLNFNSLFGMQKLDDDDFDIAPTQEKDKEHSGQSETHQNAERFVEAITHNKKNQGKGKGQNKGQNKGKRTRTR